LLILVPIPKAFGTGLLGTPIRIGINPQKYRICPIHPLLCQYYRLDKTNMISYYLNELTFCALCIASGITIQELKFDDTE